MKIIGLVLLTDTASHQNRATITVIKKFVINNLNAIMCVHNF